MSTQTEKDQDHLLNEVTVPTQVSKPLDKAFDRAYGLYWKDGGVAQIQAQLEKAVKPFREAMENGLFESAKAAIEVAKGETSKAAELFAAACAQLEFRAKAKYNKGRSEDSQTNNMQIILPGWTLAKTVAIKFFKEGRDIKATETVKDEAGAEVQKDRFSSIADMRKVVTARGANTPAAATTEVPGVFERGTAKLNGVMKAVGNTLAQLTAENMDKAAEILERANKEVYALLLAQREAERDARNSIDAAIGGTPVLPQAAKATAMRAGTRI